MAADLPADISETQRLLIGESYVASYGLAASLHLPMTLDRPLLLEGEAGVGKTELAKATAAALGRPLVRLQCYEGLDVSSAAYEWNYSRQLMHMRAQEASGVEKDVEDIERDIYTESYLLKRPLLQALEQTSEGIQIVLLIDELDRADEPFEAFLLEILADYQFSIPELGTIKADQPPITILTSNRTRDLHDAIRRRCVYHWLDFPESTVELRILQLRVPEANATLSKQVVAFVKKLRQLDLQKNPGIAETIDWATALVSLEVSDLTVESIDHTLGVLLKHQDDMQQVYEESPEQLLQSTLQSEGPVEQSVG